MVYAKKLTTEIMHTKNDRDAKKKTFRGSTIKERLQYIKEVITIEPLICCLVVAKVVWGPALANLHFEKACKVNAGFNDTVCDAILTGTYKAHNFTEQNNEVQAHLTSLRSWEVPVSSIVPVILVAFLGSYSDRRKIRKPFLLMPIIGDIIALLGTVFNIIYMSEWSLEVQAIADGVIPSLFGADKLIRTISYAYIADISTPEMRTVRMAVIPIVLNICIPIVHALSGILFRAVGYMPILFVSLLLLVAAFFYGIFFIKEPRQKLTKESNTSLLKDLFDVKHALDAFKLLVKDKGTQRNNLIKVLIMCYIHITVNSGEHSAFFLFTQVAYQWTVVEFSYFTTLGTIVNLIGLSVAVPIFANIFHLDDLIIILISYLDAVVVSATFVIFQSPIGLYVGRILSVLKPPGHAATRSQLTKYVSHDDMAKALSLNTIVSAIAAASSAQIYHQGIYEYTRTTFPHAFLLFGIAMHSLAIAIVIWMYCTDRRNQKNHKQENMMGQGTYKVHLEEITHI